MTKLEELTELLVNEINEFNKGITKLEEITNKISTTKVSIDITEYKAITETHRQKMNEQINTQERFENRFERLLKTAKIYPKWAVITLILTLLLCFSSLLYAYTAKENSNTIEKMAYKKGTDDYGNYINQFFETNPKSKQAFEKWEGNNNH